MTLKMPRQLNAQTNFIFGVKMKSLISYLELLRIYLFFFKSIFTLIYLLIQI